MIEKIKYKLKYLLKLSLRKIMEVISFFYEIVRHPIKNISILLTGLLSLLIYKNLSMEIKGIDMFLMSLGLVSIITFISNFLENQTIDIANKDNFYLGHNIKKMKFHDNFWFKRFNELPVRLFFWIIATLPVSVMYSELEYNSKILNSTSAIIVENIKYIESIWTAAFIVCAFYCTTLLIESISLSSKNFSQSYLYKITNEFEKLKIKIEIKHNFKEIFNNLFNFKSIFKLENDFYTKVEGVTNYVINRGNEVSLTDLEKIEFYNLAFKSEGEKIDEILSKIYKYSKYNLNKKYKNLIKKFLFIRNVKMVKLYYQIKWNTLIRLDVLPLGIMNIAIQDLRRLLVIEKELHKSNEYKEIFRGIYSSGKYYLFKKDKVKSNLCISRICEILEEKFRDINFLNNVNDIYEVMCLFDVLHAIDIETKGSIYFPSIFKILFEYIIDDKSKENEFVKMFYKSMIGNYLPEYLVKERNEFIKKVLLRGDLITNNILEYLLDFMQLEDIIVVLIFRLAYSERSHRKIMTIDEFKVWKKAINKLTGIKDINDLKKSKFIDVLCSEISNSRISHFIVDKFIKWMWLSLFEKFDEKKYGEFMKLGKDGIRRDFSLDSYIIMRLLLCRYPYHQLALYDFKDENRNQIKNELCSIKDIFYQEGGYI